MKGLLISFDGTDSSGKETQAGLLARRLSSRGLKVHQFQTPDYSTATGEQLKSLFQGSPSAISWTDKMKLFAANRAEHRNEVIAALEHGDIIIYDRYIPSSLAFITVEAHSEDSSLSRRAVQGAVANAEYTENNMPLEDVSIFLDVPVNIATKMLEKRKEKLADEDEYTDHVEVQKRLYHEYELLCQARPDHFLRINCLDGNQLRSVKDISEAIWQEVTHRFPELNNPSRRADKTPDIKETQS